MAEHLFEIGDFVRVKPKFWPKKSDKNLSGHLSYGIVVKQELYEKVWLYLVRHEGPELRALQWWSEACLLQETPLEILSRAGQ